MPIERVRRQRPAADVLEDVNQVHEVAFALASHELDEVVFGDVPRGDPSGISACARDEAPHVRADVVEVLRVVVAEVEVLAAVDVEPVVHLLARRQDEEHPFGSDLRQEQPVGARRQPEIFGLVEGVDENHHRLVAALRSRLVEQPAEKCAVLSGLGRQRDVVQLVADDQLRAHVLEEQPRRADVLRGDVEVMNVAPRLDQLAEQRGLADARLTSDRECIRMGTPGRRARHRPPGR